MFSSLKFIELTHLLTPSVPTWNGSCGFCLEVKKDYDRVFRVQQIKLHAGVGTHMDAPSHRFEKGSSIAEISLEKLIVPAYVIDVSAKASENYEISLQDVEQFEKEHGKISSNSLVILHTGWDRFWLTPDVYRNVDKKGQMHFPACSAKAAELLLQRDVAGLAIDTLSPDCLDLTFPVHQKLLGAGKYIIENLANASQLPPIGSYVIALPLRADEATEAPLRIVGLAPK
jgi:kynurenine formamidase